MNDWAIAILPLLGVALGAGLQFWLGRVGERERHAETLQAQAYVDYLRAVAAAGHARSNGDLQDAQRDAADAKARIAIYGTAGVIEALARFEEAGPVVDKGSRSGTAFIALVSSMREGRVAVRDRDLELLLLGPDDRPDPGGGAALKK